MANLSSSLEHLIKQFGKECIYKENGVVMHVQLVSLNMNVDMLQLKFKILPTHGFTKKNIRIFECSCLIDAISFHKNRIYGSLINFEIFFKESEVQEIVKLMGTMPNIDFFLQEIRKYRKP